MNPNDPHPGDTNGGGFVPKEARDRMVKDALADFYKKHNPSPVTPIQIITHRAQACHQEIWMRCVQRMKALKDAEHPFQQPIEADELFNDFINVFRSFDKDTLLTIFAQINAEFMTERAEDWYNNL